MGKALAYVIGVLVGLAVLWLMLPGFEKLRASSRAVVEGLAARVRELLRKVAEPPPPRPLEPEPALPPRGPDAASLHAQLVELEAIYAPTVSTSPHPSELAANAEFR